MNESYTNVRIIYTLLLFSENLYYVSIVPDRYRSVPVFISARSSVSIGTDFLRHDFCNEEGLERSDSESHTRRIG